MSKVKALAEVIKLSNPFGNTKAPKRNVKQNVPVKIKVSRCALKKLFKFLELNPSPFWTIMYTKYYIIATYLNSQRLNFIQMIMHGK